MKQSQLFAPTLRDNPSDAEVKSHQLLLRAGYIRQVSAGMYAYLPLAYRVIKKIEDIIREELDRIGGTEILLPSVIPADLWRESGRYDTYGPELMELKDRHDRDFILGPTHEETFTDLLKNDIKSYKDLPLHLYQIQAKYRDEKRPRSGLLRTREFIMKDGYTFHATQESLDETYQEIYDAYKRIFKRIGLQFVPIVADAGSMGGKESIEFQAFAEIGEDIIAYSTEGDYAANIEIATSYYQERPNTEVQLERQLVETPGIKTIEELAEFLKIEKNQIIKVVLFIADGRPVMALVRGDHEVNEVKVRMAVEAETIEQASPEQVERLFKGIVPGFAGPIDVSEDMVIVADRYIKNAVNAVTGANQVDKHYLNVTAGKDFEPDVYTDIRMVQEGDRSPSGEGTLQFSRGIEIGHVFKLGTRFSESMGAEVLGSDGRPLPVIMGSYGIGISRLLAAIAEQYADDKGLVWPRSVAPFDIHLVPIQWKNDDQRILTEQLAEKLEVAGFEALVDDRDERPGVKFTDAELYGIPIQITLGKKVKDGIVEVNVRKSGDTIEVRTDEIIDTIKILLQSGEE